MGCSGISAGASSPCDVDTKRVSSSEIEMLRCGTRRWRVCLFMIVSFESCSRSPLFRGAAGCLNTARRRPADFPSRVLHGCGHPTIKDERPRRTGGRRAQKNRRAVGCGCRFEEVCSAPPVTLDEEDKMVNDASSERRKLVESIACQAQPVRCDRYGSRVARLYSLL